MKKIFIISIFIISIFTIEYSFAWSNVDNYELCWKSWRTSVDNEVISRDNYITNKLQEFYKKQNICDEIYLMSYQILSNFDHYIVSIRKWNNIYIIKDDEIIHNIDDSQYQSLVVGVGLSNYWENYLYSFILLERNDFLEQVWYKSLLGFYLNGIRVQNFWYKEGIWNFYKKYWLEYYFWNIKITWNFNYLLWEQVRININEQLKKYSKNQRNIILKYIWNKKKEYDNISIILKTFQDYKKQIILDYIYAQLQIDKLIKNKIISDQKERIVCKKWWKKWNNLLGKYSFCIPQDWTWYDYDWKIIDLTENIENLVEIWKDKAWSERIFLYWDGTGLSKNYLNIGDNKIFLEWYFENKDWESIYWKTFLYFYSNEKLRNFFYNKNNPEHIKVINSLEIIK
jgi:hypothetical protein